jgi:hypothetical protein
LERLAAACLRVERVRSLIGLPLIALEIGAWFSFDSRIKRLTPIAITVFLIKWNLREKRVKVRSSGFGFSATSMADPKVPNRLLVSYFLDLAADAWPHQESKKPEGGLEP